jgi:tight adherence protein C
MLDLVYQRLSDTQFVASVLVGVAAAATAYTVAQPLLEGDSLGRRMKAVALEREKIRARERERLSKGQPQKVTLRQQPKAYMRQVWSASSSTTGSAPKRPRGSS